MAVRFVCSCGQVLRAAESLPDYAVVCPVCGKPVGGATPLPPEKPPPKQSVPDTPPPRHRRRAAPTQESQAADNTFTERPQPARPAQPKPGEPPEDAFSGYPSEAPQRNLSDDEARQIRRWLGEARQELNRKHTNYRAWRREKHWYECLFYPFHALPLVLLLAVAWAIATPFLTFLLPQGWDLLDLLPWLPVAAIFSVLLAYTAAFLWNILYNATEGDAGVVPWPGRDLATIAKAGGVCLVCFLAGPVVPAAVAFLFWLHSADLVLIDVLILLELAFLAFGSWTVLTLTVWLSGRLGDAGPAGLVRLWQRRGAAPFAVALLGAVLMLGQGWLVLRGLDFFHRQPVLGWLLLVLEWVGCLAGLMALLRWLGLVMYWRKKALKKEQKRSRQEEAERERAEEDLVGDVLLDREVSDEAIQDLAPPQPPGSGTFRSLPDSSDPDRRSTRVS